MSRIGIHKIGFKELNQVNDQWVQQQEEQQQAQKKVVQINKDGSLAFQSIDQRTANLTENMDDTDGVVYNIDLSFTVRKDADIDLARRYAGCPVVVYAWGVDGNKYTIGTKEYPARLVISDRYSGLDTREVVVKVAYQSISRLLR